MSAEKLKEVEQLESEGYYDFDKIKQRIEDKIQALNKDLLQKAEALKNKLFEGLTFKFGK